MKYSQNISVHTDSLGVNTMSTVIFSQSNFSCKIHGILSMKVLNYTEFYSCQIVNLCNKDRYCETKFLFLSFQLAQFNL